MASKPSVSPTETALTKQVYSECKVMFDHAMKNGKHLDPAHVKILDKDVSEVNTPQLIPTYNYLVDVVKPASPGTLVLFEKNRNSKSPLRHFGPLPIVRNFMLVTILSLLALILTSLSKNVNAVTIQLSMLQGDGWDQVERLAFLLSAASVGASFYALFKMNTYINEGTFDTKYSSTYWGRFVLGLVAGILLSELLVAFIDPVDVSPETAVSETNPITSTGYLLKPVLAILGGFSSNLVWRVLNRLIESIESLFKGSTEALVKQNQQQAQLEQKANEEKIRNNTARNLIALKKRLIDGGASDEILGHVDEAMSQVVSSSHVPAAED